MATISDIIKSRLAENHRKSTVIDDRISMYTKRMNESSSPKNVIENDEIFELIRKRKYDKASELARMRKLNPFSLFNGVNVFGKVYDNLPFIAAALAIASEKKSKDESVGQRMSNVLTQVFKPYGADSKNMFDAKFSTPCGSDDILTFVLTKDGSVSPSKEYDNELDLDTLVLLHSILSGGYTISDASKLLKYVFSNDLISTLRFMVENDMYTPSIESISTYGISPKSNIGRMISVVAKHPFALHSPEIEYDDKGKFSGGTLYEALKRVGYDISDFNSKQVVHPSIVWMIKDAILNAYVNYTNNGENFTNSSDVCFPDGSEFMDAVEKLLYLCSEYKKFTNGYETGAYKPSDRERYLRELVKSSNAFLLKLNSGLNSILEILSLPKVKFALKNPLEDGDKDVSYKAINFMKEIWDSMKPGRKRFVKK